MTPEDEILMVALRQAYRAALVVQNARDEYARLAKEKDTETRTAWDRVYQLQRQLMGGGGDV